VVEDVVGCDEIIDQGVHVGLPEADPAPPFAALATDQAG
jgi:hypothetical protein